MSLWTYISGTITVSPFGRTQPEKRYILDTVLAHLPQVTGSEENMNTYVIQKKDITVHVRTTNLVSIVTWETKNIFLAEDRHL